MLTSGKAEMAKLFTFLLVSVGARQNGPSFENNFVTLPAEDPSSPEDWPAN